MRSSDTSIDRPPLRPGSLAELLERPPDVQRQFGYGHTAEEIHHQPGTWIDTARQLAAYQPILVDCLAQAGVTPSGGTGLVLTGSGSSLYVGDCLVLPLQRALQVPVAAVPSGELLTHLDAHLAAPRGLVVSFARSGDSPESSAAVDEVRAARPGWHHLIITCNGHGRLAGYDGRDGVRALVLDDRTCDRSLVMTSSFTNMTVAASALAWLGRTGEYRSHVEQLAAVAGRILRGSDGLAALAQQDFRSAVFLGSGARHGSARESALKMLEMSGGRVHAVAETYLGLRHGPMCAIREDTLVVCFLSSDQVTRAYELDLIHELNRKQLGTRLVVGDAVPDEIVRDTDCRVECPGLASIGDDLAAITDVVVGQLLALFRCLALGLRPDAPSNDNVINRVVGEFAIHRRHARPA